MMTKLSFNSPGASRKIKKAPVNQHRLYFQKAAQQKTANQKTAQQKTAGASCALLLLRLGAIDI
ncbi:MAG: hypothetical protein LBT62_06735, partial [Deltaproteobacteria bacterium]|nr:hypothetical protein [Deltaproteobacteria bacterium]